MSLATIKDPDKQRDFVLTIIEFLDNPATANQVTYDNLLEAEKYIKKLRGTKKAINESDATKVLIRILPDVPKLPPGYKSTIKNQTLFLNTIKPKLEKRYNRAIITNKNLNEAKYYINQLKSRAPEKYNLMEKLIIDEKFRRVKPPFRPPESMRPDMPHSAGIPQIDLLNNLLGKIYLSSPSEQKRAYDTFVDVFLTDWMNRKGSIKNGKQIIQTPFFDSPEYLVFLQSEIERRLQHCEEKPNPKTLDKKPGNSYRQQLYKDIREKIINRLYNLQEEEFNKITKLHRGRGYKTLKKYKSTKKSSKTRKHN